MTTLERHVLELVDLWFRLVALGTLAFSVTLAVAAFVAGWGIVCPVCVAKIEGDLFVDRQRCLPDAHDLFLQLRTQDEYAIENKRHLKRGGDVWINRKR